MKSLPEKSLNPLVNSVASLKKSGAKCFIILNNAYVSIISKNTFPFGFLFLQILICYIPF